MPEGKAPSVTSSPKYSSDFTPVGRSKKESFLTNALGGHWGYLFLGFLANLTLVGYGVSSRVGAALYNLVHSTLLPLALVGAGFTFDLGGLTLAGLIMLTHIGFDRMAGYGLKYPDAFKHTHLDA